MEKLNIAIVGATGMVGKTFLKVLEERHIEIENLYLYAGESSAGSTLTFAGKEFTILKLCEENIKGKKIDYALFSVPAELSLEYSPIFSNYGAVVIDNSNAFRMCNDIPLVVPEVNAREAFKHSGIIANPNCSTIQCVLPLKALDDKFNLRRIIYTSFQSVSGSGYKGIKDLQITQSGEKPEFYPHPIYNNCIPHIDEFTPNGYTKEEMKMVNETKKIMGRPYLEISATCVRVPVMYGHSVDVYAEFENNFEIKEVYDALTSFKGIIVRDDPENNIYPLAANAKGHDEVLVGRIRRDISHKNALRFFCVADNIRKGAATNAIQIMELLISKNKQTM